MANITENNKFPLNQIYFYLTEGCNLACRHCWLAPKFDADGTRYPTLPVELFETAIREAKPLGLTGIKLTGGEPLLHPEFLTLLKITKQEDLELTIETNGVLCGPEIAAQIAQHPDCFVSISIDGVDAETHDRMRGVSGAFKRAVQAVRNLVDVDMHPQIIMSVMRSNAHQVDDMVRMAEGLGASSVKFNVIQPFARGKTLQAAAETLTIEELIELGRRVDMTLAPGTQLSLVFDHPAAFRPLSCIADSNGCDTCGIFGILGVIADGQYALCGIGKHVSQLVFGEVGKDRLETVWQENQILKAIREGLPDHLGGICARCLMKHQCKGACIAQNYYCTGSLWSPFWFCEVAEKEGLFPETRLVEVAA
jgi:SynChlorMet cassette radical SAM/SPASM protein ScmF